MQNSERYSKQQFAEYLENNDFFKRLQLTDPSFSQKLLEVLLVKYDPTLLLETYPGSVKFLNTQYLNCLCLLANPDNNPNGTLMGLGFEVSGEDTLELMHSMYIWKKTGDTFLMFNINICENPKLQEFPVNINSLTSNEVDYTTLNTSDGVTMTGILLPYRYSSAEELSSDELLEAVSNI